MSIIITALIVAFLLAFSYLIVRAKRKAVTAIDNSGITRGDGRQFPWSEFQGLVTRINYERVSFGRYIWRIEFAFENGEGAWIIPYRVKNEEDVFSFVVRLPRAYLKN